MHEDDRNAGSAVLVIELHLVVGGQMRHRFPLGSKLRQVGHGIGDRIRDACVPMTSVLNHLSKREQSQISARSAYDLKRDRKSSVVETDRNGDGRKTQHIYETREAAERIERSG